MSRSLTAAREQLALVYRLMYIEGQPGYQQVAFADTMFTVLSDLLDLLPEEGVTELLFRMSDGVEAIKVAELYNVLIWSADARGVVNGEEIQEWFYTKQRRRIEVVTQVDLFPSNSMDESERVIAGLRKQFPDLDYLLKPLAKEVKAQIKEEKAWSDYRRETFEMPKEMTPGILNIIKDIKLR
ncbi:hypothetical protein LEM8419_02116 [Neolewinella maritima]|uniref:CdiI immunity protein domain-containing protein n=1 Tax=Neolewinella maritima TaxID=1383882 RepID=A0ABM9B1K3_9BACT|nr:hypothetical protein [Neolewinella maritima]CAH1001217.1 hypothetical protein LEM8419_02116 [Neolewinella maritima]